MGIWTCSGCGRKFRIKPATPTRAPACPRCGRPLRTTSPPRPQPAPGETSLDLVSGSAFAGSGSGTDLQEDSDDVGGRPPGGASEAPTPRGETPAGGGGLLGGYRLVRIMAEGGMGLVYLAQDPELDRQVAIKTIKPSLAAVPATRRRFLREARAAAAIEHDHVIPIYHVGEDRGIPFYAMPVLKGESLGSRAKRERTLPFGEVLRIGREIAEGLAAAHSRGLIHRDIKPDNIWLEGQRARVVILDFGLAHVSKELNQLTTTGDILGTPLYMAPEQAQGKTVDRRCDLFSLGGVLYRLSTGKTPFKGANATTILESVIKDHPPAPAAVNPDLPGDFSDLVLSLLAKDPAERPPSADAVAEALRAMEARAAQEPGDAVQKTVPAEPAAVELVVTAGPDQGRTFFLRAGDSIFLGRSRATGHALVDPRVSRVHCQLDYDGRQLTVADFDSTTGTFVNGKRVTRQGLRHGDEVAIGGSCLAVRFDRLPDDAADTLGPASAPAADSGQRAGLWEGKTLGRYVLGPVLARGRLGIVFRGRHVAKNRIVAVKVLWPEFGLRPEGRERFIRVARAGLKLHHPHVVRLHGAGNTRGHCWLAMEYVEGDNLAEVAKRHGGRLPWADVVRVAVHVARALEFAHQHRIVHRNVTPTNVLVRSADQVAKLDDLVLADALGPQAERVTSQGVVLANVAFLAPEQALGGSDLDGRADLYGLGATMYTALTGRPPFAGSDLEETLDRIVHADPARPTEVVPDLPPPLEATILKLLAKRPDARYQDAAGLLADLQRTSDFSPSRA